MVALPKQSRSAIMDESPAPYPVLVYMRADMKEAFADVSEVMAGVKPLGPVVVFENSQVDFRRAALSCRGQRPFHQRCRHACAVPRLQHIELTQFERAGLRVGCGRPQGGHFGVT